MIEEEYQQIMNPNDQIHLNKCEHIFFKFTFIFFIHTFSYII